MSRRGLELAVRVVSLGAYAYLRSAVVWIAGRIVHVVCRSSRGAFGLGRTPYAFWVCQLIVHRHQGVLSHRWLASILYELIQLMHIGN